MDIALGVCVPGRGGELREGDAVVVLPGRVVH